MVAVAAAAIAVSFLFAQDEDQAPTAKSGKSTPVSVVAVERGPMTQRGRYPGELDADTADVAAFFAGRIIDVRVRVGDLVKQGDVVAELDPVDAKEQIAQARAQARAAAAERTRAKVERDAAASEVARLEPLAQQQLISALEIDRQRARANALGAAVESAAASEAEAQARVRLLEKRLSESVVRAPFAGRIAERYVDPGAVVSAGARLVRVVATAPLRIRFEVPETDISRLAKDTKLAVVTQAAAERSARATVTGVASEVSRERRVATVEAILDDAPAGWLPGMFAEAVVDLRVIPDATIVPANAVLSRLQSDGKVSVGVLIAGDGGVARWIEVKEVAREGDRVAVDGQLPPRAKLLVAGHVDLSDGSKITIVDGARPVGAAGSAR